VASRGPLLHAVGANARHGLRRTNADKRRAVELLLADAEWAAKSSNWIAQTRGVSAVFGRCLDLHCLYPRASGWARPRETRLQKTRRTMPVAPGCAPA
jgi:hypothetical protein